MNVRRSQRLLPCFRVGAGLVVLLLVVGFLTACEYPGVPPLTMFPAEEEGILASPPEAEETPTESTPEAGETPTEPTPTPEAGETPAEPTPEAGPPEARVEIFLRDFRLDPNTITVKAGKITFVLGNRGRYTHDFRVEGQGIDEKAPKVGAGRTFEWEITLEPGEYNISCPISNHAERGMTGTLVVTE